MNAAAAKHGEHDWSGARTDTRAPAVAAALLLLSLLLLVLLPSSTLAATEKVMSFGPDGTEATSFESIDSIAVDQQEGWVYILDGTAGTLSKFDSGGEPVDFGGGSGYISGNRISGLSPWTYQNSGSTSGEVAVDSTSHRVYVAEQHAVRAFQPDGEPVTFSSGPGAGTSEIPGFVRLAGIAVDGEGNIYAADHEAATVKVFSASGTPLNEITATHPTNLAGGPSGHILVVEKDSTVLKSFTPSSVPVTEATTFSGNTLFEKEPSVAWGLYGVTGISPTGDLYVLESNFAFSRITKRDATGAPLETIGDPESGEAPLLEGFSRGLASWLEPKDLGPGEELAFYAGDNEHHWTTGFGQKIFIGPPGIEHTSALDVTADSATLRGWVDPNTISTTYRFEYGLGDCAVGGCTSVPVGGGKVGDGEDPVQVSQPISGLESGTTYHYRIVAENTLHEVTEGPDTTLTTQPFGLGFDPIDHRVWEMVSPIDKHGGLVTGPSQGILQAARDGNGLAYLSKGPIVADPDGNRSLELSSVIAKRDAAGWATRSISPANHRIIPFVGGEGSEFRLFTPDLTKALVEPRDGTLLSPEASERTAYVWHDGDPPVFEPLLTGKEGFANVPPGTEFGGGQGSNVSPVAAAGASADLRYVALQSEVPLTLDSPPNAGVVLYLWSGRHLEPLSILPAAEGGGFSFNAMLGSKAGSVKNAISQDGSRVFWAPGSYFNTLSSLSALYMRDIVAEQTIRLDVPQPDASGDGPSEPRFEGANPEGTVVYFSDTRRLTADASSEGRDLYRCELPIGSLEEGCASLLDLTAPLPGSGEKAELPGVSLGISEDGSHAYFVARDVLDTTPNQRSVTAVAGKPNLYSWQQGTGVRFLSTLDEKDSTSWGFSRSPYPVGSFLSAAVSPSGRYLTFMSQRSLTGRENLSAEEGIPVQEVFRYDAVTDALDCISCNPSGAAPEAEIPALQAPVDAQEQWSRAELFVAATLPPPNAVQLGDTSLYRPRTTLDNGRVFFNAFDSLVPGDSNGQWDVYQYEPTGVGGCTAASGDAATVATAGGCVSLLSSGTAEEETAFLDASESGDDVFLLTPAQLSAADPDEELDVYDARVDGTAATLPSRSECQGESCQAGAGAPDDPTPGTATFTGPGDLKPASKRCPRGKRKVRHGTRVRCIPRKHSRRKTSRNHKQAGHGRRAAR
jgi:hypothetical protein